MHTVAALYVQPDGVYSTMPDVDPWPESRDARTYAGPLPVVAHPPCASWGRYAKPTPDSTARGPLRGADGGCFAAALDAVRLWGGLLEHPAGSMAWPAHRLPAPEAPADEWGGMTVAVEQCWWGHDAIKPTWLYVVGVPALAFPAQVRPAGVRPLEHMSKRQRAATPPAFARWLVGCAARAAGAYG